MLKVIRSFAGSPADRLVGLTYTTIISVLICASALLFFGVHYLQVALAANSEANSIGRLAEAVVVQVKDAESAQLDYLHSQKKTGLPAFTAARGEVFVKLATLALQVKNNPAQTQLVWSLRNLCEKKLEALTERIRVQDSEGSQAALTLIADSEEPNQTAAISDLAKNLQDIQNQRLVDLAEKSTGVLRNTYLGITFVGLLALVVVLSALSRIDRGLRAKPKSEEAQLKNNEHAA